MTGPSKYVAKKEEEEEESMDIDGGKEAGMDVGVSVMQDSYYTFAERHYSRLIEYFFPLPDKSQTAVEADQPQIKHTVNNAEKNREEWTQQLMKQCFQDEKKESTQNQNQKQFDNNVDKQNELLVTPEKKTESKTVPMQTDSSSYSPEMNDRAYLKEEGRKRFREKIKNRKSLEGAAQKDEVQTLIMNKRRELKLKAKHQTQKDVAQEIPTDPEPEEKENKVEPEEKENETDPEGGAAEPELADFMLTDSICLTPLDTKFAVRKPLIVQKNIPHPSFLLHHRKQHSKKSVKNLGHFINFKISVEKANEIFVHWSHSLWFAPIGFTMLLEQPEITALFVPFYSISTQVRTTYKDLTAGAAVSDIVLENEYSYFAYAGDDQGDEEELLSKINNWNLKTQQPIASISNEQETSSCASAYNEMVRGALNVNTVWKNVEKKIITQEKEKASADFLKRKAASSDPASRNDGKNKKANMLADYKFASVSYQDTTVARVYVPIYVIAFQYNSKSYNFMINGETGKTFGRRPYGVGKLLGGGLNFLENVFELTPGHQEGLIGLVDGATLRKIDRCNFYAPSAVYLIFPPSHSYLVTSGTYHFSC
eukprot:TRINITY_DN2537_c0_g1_i3.p1 TRINITY_DN2537_c0_g1~~TRINITY_DN2537_c0_g1_i3.p1  ORF type:complete len:618 (+),score=131.85 TRINITY_DN2537_c0_g1_i3:71-1855(+)